MAYLESQIDRGQSGGASAERDCVGGEPLLAELSGLDQQMGGQGGTSGEMGEIKQRQ